MRRLLRRALIGAWIAAILLLTGCGYILVEDRSANAVIPAPESTLAVPASNP